ncbi:septation protein SepH [Dermacoccus nishinomiyaensis]|uniref:septation protein SepH n=1 Tax=Dermacoccus nishinomiyaensis TaxID=1274 RepID=UPI001EF65D72|nr:septation protein SepH [Dermacoccus nishinomiyaensis]
MEFVVQELRLVGVAEDGANLLLADGDGGRFTLAITDELRTTIRRDRREPASADRQAKQENPLRPRDVQGLIRGGVPLEEIAERAGWSLEKVQRYEGPIRAERDYVSELAQRVQLFGRGETTTLRERADRRLAERGVEAERVVWDSWKNDDTHWTVIVRFPAGGRQREATWLFDPVNRALRTVDDEARWLGGDEIAAADEDSPQRQKAAARKGGARTHRDAPVYDVEAEGGLADAQDPHLGARLSPSDPRAGAGDLTASMRARQASRGRGRSSSQRSSGGAGTTSATSRATQLPASMAPTERTERIDVGTTPPPLPSHPRPEELTESGDESREAPVNTAGGKRDSSGRDGDAVTNDAVTTSAAGSGADARGVTGASDDDSHAGAQSDDTNSETSHHVDVDEASGKAARGSRRRKSRRPRARVEQASVRGALRDDDDEHDESLFGELPGHHDGGDVYEDDAIDAEEHDGEHEFDDVATDSSAEFDDEVAAQAENESSDDAESASAADEETSGTETREAAPTKNDTTSRDASSKGTSKGTSPAVPPRASQSRKSSRPSVPSWDDIMFGGRGPKK